MYYGIMKEYSKHNVIYNKQTQEFTSDKEIGSYIIIYNDSLFFNKECMQEKIAALEIAENFAGLHKKKGSKNTIFIESVIDFISKYGMMGIHQDITRLNRKDAYPKELLLDWETESRKMFEVFKKLSYLRENQPFIGPGYIDGLPQNIPDEAFSMNYRPENMEDLNKEPSVVLAEINHTINEYLINVHPYLITDLYRDKIYSRPMMDTYNLLSSMYFAIFQAVQDSIKFCICEKCGSPFTASSQKLAGTQKVAEKGSILCNQCVVAARTKRRNKSRFSNDFKRFRYNLNQRIDYYYRKSYKTSTLNDFVANLKLEDYKKNPHIWIEEKRQAFDNLVKMMKKEE